MGGKSADLLTLSMIVKNEARTLARTLTSAKPFIDRWVILDTGSTDGTMDLIRRTLEGVPGELHEAPFVDFATTRNHALDLAGTATEFVTWLDADDELVGGPALRAFLERERSQRGPDREAYFLRIEMGFKFDSPRIARTRAGWRFRGVVHEILVREGRPPPVHRVPDAAVRHHVDAQSEQRSRQRWERDVGLLGGALEKDPSDTRSAFYLALSLLWLGRYEEAKAAFHRRIALGGWYEEIYESRLRLAHIAAATDAPWAEQLELYLAAHASSPHRAEPLHAIALHYNALGKHALCFLFARRGLEIPLPARDTLFVDEEAYTWKLADLVASSAYWIGEFSLGETAARQALRHRPHDERLKNNLEHYLARKRREKNRR